MTAGRGVQADFGGFDPRFLGITIRFGAFESWDRFRAGRELTEAELRESPDPVAFRAMAEATVTAHECRHFHDFLLSPYGQIIFRLKLQAMVSGFQALALLYRRGRAERANCLPVPVSRWCRKPEAERARIVAGWNRARPAPGDRGWAPPRLPVLPADLGDIQVPTGAMPDSEEAFAAILVQTIRAYDRVRDHVHNPASQLGRVSLQPWHLMEVSALLVQMRQIGEAFGAEAVRRFQSGLIAHFHDPCMRYIGVLCDEWKSRGRLPDLGTLAAVVTWALTGDYAAEGWNACPTHRTARLHEVLRERGPPPEAAPLAEVFAEWSRLTGLSRPVEALRGAVRRNAEILEKIQARTGARAGLSSGVRRDALTGARMLHRATQHMLRAFEQDPDSYVRPGPYLEGLDRWVRPPVRCEFDGFLLGAPEGRERGFWKGWQVLFARQDANGRRFARTVLPPTRMPGAALVPADAAARLFVTMLSIDYVFLPINRLDWEFEVTRAELPGKSGLRPLELLS